MHKSTKSPANTLDAQIYEGRPIQIFHCNKIESQEWNYLINYLRGISDLQWSHTFVMPIQRYERFGALK